MSNVRLMFTCMIYLCLISQHDMASNTSLDQVLRSVISLSDHSTSDTSDRSVYTDDCRGSRTYCIILLELEFQLLLLVKMTLLKELYKTVRKRCHKDTIAIGREVCRLMEALGSL